MRTPRPAPVLAETLKRPHEKHARAAGRVKKASLFLDFGRQKIPYLRNYGVGEKHWRVIGTLGGAARLPLAQKPVVDGADQLDRYVLEIVSAPEPKLGEAAAHFLAAGTEPRQNFQMRTIN